MNLLPTITNKGVQLVNEVVRTQNTSLKFTYIGIGDQSYTPNPAEAAPAMKNRIERQPVKYGKADAKGFFEVEAVFQELPSGNSYSVFEIGLYCQKLVWSETPGASGSVATVAEDDILFSVMSSPGVELAKRIPANDLLISFAHHLEGVSGDKITVNAGNQLELVVAGPIADMATAFTKACTSQIKMEFEHYMRG
jgi:hypothetical protein